MLLPSFSMKIVEPGGDLLLGGSLKGESGGGGGLAAVFQAPPPENRYNLNINSINSIRS